MSEVDFSKLLAKKVDDTKPPPTLPAGTYEGLVEKSEFKTTQKGAGYVNFTLKLTGAKDDVDPEELKNVNLSQKKLFKSFFFDMGEGLDWQARSEVELAEFLRSLGISTQGKGYGETIPETQNAPVIIEVTNRLNPKNPEETFTEAGKVQGA
jgi:hypothetical protein